MSKRSSCFVGIKKNDLFTFIWWIYSLKFRLEFGIVLSMFRPILTKKLLN